MIQPDGSFLIYTYDPAHRLTGITDALGDHVAYKLDAAGNIVNEQAFDPSGILRQTRSYAYSTLDRLKKTIGAEGQTTVYGYDKQGNLTVVNDPLNHATNYAYDPLNRLAEAIDPKGGTTFYAYDANDQFDFGDRSARFDDGLRVEWARQSNCDYQPRYRRHQQNI